MKNLLLGLFTLFAVTSFATPMTYTVTKGVTTNVTCNVGDTLKFYGTVYSAYGVSINSVVVIAPHLCNTPYYIGYYVIVGGETSFTINGSPNWPGTITVNPTGINEQTNNSTTITVFPNPLASSLNVTVNGDKETLTMINQNGQTVLRTPILKGTTEIDLSTFSSGVYFLRVGNKSTRIIKD